MTQANAQMSAHQQAQHNSFFDTSLRVTFYQQSVIHDKKAMDFWRRSQLNTAILRTMAKGRRDSERYQPRNSGKMWRTWSKKQKRQATRKKQMAMAA